MANRSQRRAAPQFKPAKFVTEEQLNDVILNINAALQALGARLTVSERALGGVIEDLYMDMGPEGETEDSGRPDSGNNPVDDTPGDPNQPGYNPDDGEDDAEYAIREAARLRDEAAARAEADWEGEGGR